MATASSAVQPSGPEDDGAVGLLRRLAALQAENARLTREVARLRRRRERDAGALEHMSLAVSALRGGVLALRADNAELRRALSALHAGRHQGAGAARG